MYVSVSETTGGVDYRKDQGFSPAAGETEVWGWGRPTCLCVSLCEGGRQLEKAKILRVLSQLLEGPTAYMSVCMLACARGICTSNCSGSVGLGGLACPGASSWGDRASRASYRVDWVSKPRYWSDVHCVYMSISYWWIFILISQRVGQNAAIGALCVCVSAGCFCLYCWLGAYVYMCCIHVFVCVPTKNTFSALQLVEPGDMEL